RARLGLARTFQQPTVARSLTVAENMVLAASFGRPRATSRASGRTPREIAAEYLEFVGLAGKAQVQSDLLGVYDRKSLMLGTALATGSSASFLAQPFGRLNPPRIPRPISLIRGIREGRPAFVCIHNPLRWPTPV